MIKILIVEDDPAIAEIHRRFVQQMCIRDSIKSAREGDGFSEYWTNKPSVGRDAPKLSFNLVLDKYQWVVGTGFYIDDIDNELARCV